MKIEYLDQANSLANKIGNLKIATNSKQSDRLIALGINLVLATDGEILEVLMNM